MKALDFSRPAPRVKTLDEAQTLIDQLWAIVGEQARRIEQLEEAVGLDSRTSSKPPSSDSAKAREKRPRKPRSGRSKGGQPGHPKHERALVDAVDQTEAYYPPSHCGCGGQIVIAATPYRRHQVFDLPVVRYTVTEYHAYEGACQGCGRVHRSELPQWVPAGQLGPGLIGEIGLLNSQYRMSLRQVQQYLQARWDLRFSLGAISQSQRKLTRWLSPVYAQIGAWVRRQAHAHADETTHYHHRSRYWLWTLCTDKAAYFMAHWSRGKTTANDLIGEFKGVLITDRYTGYNDYPRRRRQLCWAHVIRGLERIARRRGVAGVIGQRLVRLARLVIRVVHHHRRGCLSEARYRHRLKRLRAQFKNTLKRAERCHGQPRTQGQCRALLAEESMLWTFLRYPGLPLTNNCAERALRPYVIWRKTSFFSQSLQGLQFRPMMLSVVTTAERLGVNTYELLRQICTQGLSGQPITARLPLPTGAVPATT